MAVTRGTVLIVDDDAKIRVVVSEVLTGAGFGVLEASTGKEGLEKVELAPDLVILDVKLPDMNGLDVCATLKAQPATRSTPVLLVSGHFTSGDDRSEGLELGGDAYLTKPFKNRELLATVNALLRLRRAETEARALAADLDEARVAASLLGLVEAVASLDDVDAILDTVVRMTPELLGVTCYPPSVSELDHP